MRHATAPILIFGILAAVVIFSSALYIIDQAEQGIIVQFGEPVGDVVTVTVARSDSELNIPIALTERSAEEMYSDIL